VGSSFTHVSDRASHTELPLGCALTGADPSAGIHFRDGSWGQSALRGFGDLRLTLFGGIRVFSDSWICVFFGNLTCSGVWDFSILRKFGFPGFGTLRALTDLVFPDV